MLPDNSTFIESPLENCSIDIPTDYAPFSNVFSPKRASQLPPYRAWDCAINLLPDDPVPKGKIYSLSIPEQKAMEEYISEDLQQGYIRPSTSPATSFFFVAKKEGGLRPCIDYRSLKRISVKYRYKVQRGTNGRRPWWHPEDTMNFWWKYVALSSNISYSFCFRLIFIYFTLKKKLSTTWDIHLHTCVCNLAWGFKTLLWFLWHMN